MSFLFANSPAREGYIKIPDVNEKATVGKWNTLPVNLLLSIFLQIDEERQAHHAPWLYTRTVLQPTLLAACIVSRCWSEVAKEVLYKDVLLTTDDAVSVFSSSLRKCERLRPLVQSVCFSRAYSRSGEDWLKFGHRGELDSIYEMCPNLLSETIDMQGSLPSRAFNRLVDPSYSRFEKQLVELQGTRLTRLNIQPVKNAINVFFAQRLAFASLEHLFISNYESEGTWNRLQWPEMPRLRSLSLFLCGFSDVHVPLPSSCRLRALEIVGGYFHTDQLWKEIVSAGDSLELLTFAPAYSSSIPYNDELASLPSLSILRICPAFCVDYRTPKEDVRFLAFPPRLVHLVTIDMPCANSKPSISFIRYHIMELVNLKKTQKAFLDLQSVRICGRPVGYERHLHDSLQAEAANAGVELLLLDISAPQSLPMYLGRMSLRNCDFLGPGYYKSLCNLFKSMDPKLS